MKKRYYNFLAIPAIAVIIFSIFTGFSSADSKTSEDSVRQLLLQRTQVLQQVYFKEVTWEEGKQQLYEIETDELLENDLASFEDFKDTDLHELKAMHITEISRQKNMFQYTTFLVSIKWDLAEGDYAYTEENHYNVVLEKQEQGYKLSLIELL